MTSTGISVDVLINVIHVTCLESPWTYANAIQTAVSTIQTDPSRDSPDIRGSSRHSLQTFWIAANTTQTALSKDYPDRARYSPVNTDIIWTFRESLETAR